MIDVVVEPYPGLNNFKSNIDKYTEMFLRGNIIVFRDANCLVEEQIEVLKALGDKLDWSPRSGETTDPTYYETHLGRVNQTNSEIKESVVLQWHLEHVGRDELYVGACWCMNVFKCDQDAGKTLFVDVVNVFDSLNLLDQELLVNSVVELHPRDKADLEVRRYSFVQKHWVTGQNILRPIFNDSHETRLVSVAGLPPTEDQITKFNNLFNQIVIEVAENKDIRYEHCWQEGDMLIFDAFKMAHAVTGGFRQGDRVLTGMFGSIYQDQ